MVLWNGTCRWLLLALSLWVSGCADSLFWRGKEKVPEGVTPPVPAPALYIPAEPTPLLPESTDMQNVSGTDQQIQKVSAQSPELLDPGVAALPALVPAAPAITEPAAENGTTVQGPMAKMRALHRQAVQRCLTMGPYVMRLRRREVVNGRKRPEEIMLCKFRKEPFSVYCKWLGKEAQGREILYVKGQHGNLIHTRVAAGDVFFLPAGKRFSLAPDNVLVKSNSRHSITEAGLENLIDQLGRLLDAVARGDTRQGMAQYLGELKRPEFEARVEGIMQVIPPKSDPLLPGGGQRLWFFDTNLHLPVLVITQDENREEVEYYCQDRIQFPVALDDDDFNPDVLWGKLPNVKR